MLKVKKKKTNLELRRVNHSEGPSPVSRKEILINLLSIKLSSYCSCGPTTVLVISKLSQCIKVYKFQSYPIYKRKNKIILKKKKNEENKEGFCNAYLD